MSWAKQGLALRVSFMSSDTLIAEQCLGPENSHAVDSASVKAKRTARFDRIFLQKNQLWVVLKVSHVMGHMRPASTASEAVTSHVPFGVSKKHRKRHFSGSGHKFKVVQRPRFRGTG